MVQTQKESTLFYVTSFEFMYLLYNEAQKASYSTSN